MFLFIPRSFILELLSRTTNIKIKIIYRIIEKDNLLKLVGFLFLLILFIVIKYPYLYKPFYWDEAWVYAPALIQMAENGPSLLPDAIHTDQSRGHPLLFHFLGGLHISIFGKSLFSVHCFALTISIACLVSTFTLAKQLFSYQVALLSCTFLMFGEIFFIESVFALPEILLATLTILSIYFYLFKKYLPLFISLSLLALTKETAIVLIAVFFFLELLLKSVRKEKINQKTVLVLIGSCVVFASTFILNKIYHGWYFYPVHTSYMQFEFDALIMRMRRISGEIFSYRDHWVLTLTIVIAFLTFAMKQKKTRFVYIATALFFVSFSLFKKYPQEINQLKIVFLGLLIFGLHALLTLKGEKKTVSQFYSTSLILAFAFITFSAINFFTNRYMLCLMPLIAISAASSINYIFRFNKVIYVIAISLILVFQINKLVNGYKYGGSYSKVYAISDCHQSIAEFISENVNHQSTVKVGFLLYHHLSNPDNGYYDHSQYDIKWTQGNDFEYVIYENIGDKYPKLVEEIKRETKLVEVFECSSPHGYQAYVYKKE